jgi:DNA repair protein RadC
MSTDSGKNWEVSRVFEPSPDAERHVTIKDLPGQTRPRERLLAEGAGALSDVELLAIIIGGGTPEDTALDIARKLLSAYGGWRELARCSPVELMERVAGIGRARAAAICAALAIAHRYVAQKPPVGSVVKNSAQLFTYLREKFHGAGREKFLAVLLDTKLRILREVEISTGSLNEAVVHPREVFRPAVRDGASKVIFVHNHPSGDPEPSEQDRKLTARLCEVGAVMGIDVLDHLIIGRDAYFSFAEKGLIDA